MLTFKLLPLLQKYWFLWSSEHLQLVLELARIVNTYPFQHVSDQSRVTGMFFIQYPTIWEIWRWISCLEQLRLFMTSNCIKLDCQMVLKWLLVYVQVYSWKCSVSESQWKLTCYCALQEEKYRNNDNSFWLANSCLQINHISIIFVLSCVIHLIYYDVV